MVADQSILWPLPSSQPIWYSLRFVWMYEWMNDELEVKLRYSSSESSGSEFCLLLSWNPALCNFLAFIPVFANSYVLVSSHMLALVCPLVSHRVMKSDFCSFISHPSPAIRLPVCPVGFPLKLSSPHISHQTSSGYISVFQSGQNFDWHLCLHLVHVLGVSSFQDKLTLSTQPNY